MARMDGLPLVVASGPCSLVAAAAGTPHRRRRRRWWVGSSRHCCPFPASRQVAVRNTRWRKRNSSVIFNAIRRHCPNLSVCSAAMHALLWVYVFLMCVSRRSHSRMSVCFTRSRCKSRACAEKFCELCLSSAPHWCELGGDLGLF